MIKGIEHPIVKPFAIWFTGLSGSGKSTLSNSLKSVLNPERVNAVILDGDVIRSGLCRDLGFNEKDRTENIRRVAELNRIFMENGISTINAFITPNEHLRKLARSIIGGEHFIEVYLSTPLATCIQRDPKGLYAKAIKGEISDFTGVSASFEQPLDADVVIDTSELGIQESVFRIVEFINLRKKLMVNA